MDFIKYINLPKVPDTILNNIPTNAVEYKTKVNYFTYNWSESNNKELNVWGRQNISSDIYLAFMLIKGDLLLHKDVGTALKLNYIIDPGSDKVVTRFWADNKKDVAAEYVIEPHRWHIFRADAYHSVHGIKKNNLRLSITARLF